MKKKVSIITLQYVDNYGSVLQTYASEYLFRKSGAEVEIVNFTRKNFKYETLFFNCMEEYKNRLGRLANQVTIYILMKMWTKRYEEKHKIFEEFRKKYLHLSKEYMTTQELMDNPPDADIYCSGSDQVWNLEYNGVTVGEYFLSYAPKGKNKVALSSSFGKTNFSEADKNKIRELVLQYDMISVREDSALKVLNELGFEGGVHLLDPTLCLGQQDWQQELPIKRVKQEKYVLVYQLNNNPDMVKFAKKLARKNKCKLLFITQSVAVKLKGLKVLKTPKVQEFLSLIKYAEYIVTDSFHGTAFSLNFQKQFFVFYPPNYSTRLESILKLTATDYRVLSRCTENAMDKIPIDYTRVNEILNNEREKAADFIDMVMSL